MYRNLTYDDRTQVNLNQLDMEHMLVSSWKELKNVCLEAINEEYVKSQIINISDHPLC